MKGEANRENSRRADFSDEHVLCDGREIRIIVESEVTGYYVRSRRRVSDEYEGMISRDFGTSSLVSRIFGRAAVGSTHHAFLYYPSITWYISNWKVGRTSRRQSIFFFTMYQVLNMIHDSTPSLTSSFIRGAEMRTSVASIGVRLTLLRPKKYVKTFEIGFLINPVETKV